MWTSVQCLFSDTLSRVQKPNYQLLCHPTAKKPNVIFALTLHGGHLGFFKGAVLFPKPLTWMDKVIVGYANAMCQWEKQKPTCQTVHLSESSCAEKDKNL